MTTLFHYTTLPTFLAIIESKSIRFCELSKSNDRAEGRFIHECLSRHLMTMSKSDLIKQFVLSSLEKFIDIYAYFGFCMTSEADDLGQWRAYANNGQGVAIGFNLEKLEECARESPLAISTKVSEVRYGFAEVFKHMGEVIGIVQDMDDGFIKNIESDKRDESLPAGDEFLKLRDAIEKFSRKCYDIKNPSFLMEKETRITQEAVYTSSSFLKYFARQGRIVPFYDVKIVPECIDCVVVGPEFEGKPHDISRVLSSWHRDLIRCKVYRSVSSARA